MAIQRLGSGYWMSGTYAGHVSQRVPKIISRKTESMRKKKAEGGVGYLRSFQILVWSFGGANLSTTYKESLRYTRLGTSSRWDKSSPNYTFKQHLPALATASHKHWKCPGCSLASPLKTAFPKTSQSRLPNLTWLHLRDGGKREKKEKTERKKPLYCFTKLILEKNCVINGYGYETSEKSTFNSWRL